MKQKQNNIIGERLTQLRKSKQVLNSKGKYKTMSQTDLSFELPFSRTTIQRYEDGTSIPEDDKLIHFARYYNVPLAYLRGDTDIKDTLQYSRWVEECESEAADEYFSEINAQVERRKALFDICGYEYSEVPAYDFSDLSNNPTDFIRGPHRLKCKRKNLDPFDLKDEELIALIDKLRKTIDFELFCIKEDEGIKNGNG